MDPINIKTRAQMAEMVMRLEQAGASRHVPLVRAAMAGALRFAFVSPGDILPLRLLDMEQDRRPFAVILADDGAVSTGSDGFPQARRLLRWAASILIHAAGGEPWHYEAVARATVLARRFLLMETNTAHQTAWHTLRMAVALRTPGSLIEVRPGDVHPRLTVPAGETVQ
ncbi:MAG: hypothetical protein IRY87_00065 [Acetobacteraceae bacterium]|nr:hypothetical protein [Acetobacteraceae bacterium]